MVVRDAKDEQTNISISAVDRNMQTYRFWIFTQSTALHSTKESQSQAVWLPFRLATAEENLSQSDVIQQVAALSEESALPLGQ